MQYDSLTLEINHLEYTYVAGTILMLPLRTVTQHNYVPTA